MAGLVSKKGRTEVDRFKGDINRLFDDFFNRGLTRPFERGDWMPVLDMSENEKEIVVNAELPGIDTKDIDISLDGRVLTIKGERKQEKENHYENYHYTERRYGSFSRAVELPTNVDGDKVKAKYKDGLLTLILPKTRGQSVKKIKLSES